MAAIVAGDGAHQHFRLALGFGLQSRHLELFRDVDPRIGVDRLHFGLDLANAGQITVAPIGQALAGHSAEIHPETAILGGDVMRGAARDDADMGRGPGRIEHRGQGRRRFRHAFGVHLIGPVDQLGAEHDRIHTCVHDRGMHLEAHNMRPETLPALVAGDGLHHRRLAHDHGRGLWQHFQHPVDHRRRAGAPHLLVIAQRQLQRARDAAVMRLDQCPDGQGVKALHVAGAAAEIFAVAFHHGPGIIRPGLAIHGHDIGMARQDQPARHLWPHMGKDRGLVIFLVVMPMRGDAVAVQIVLDPIHQRQVAVAADRGKADQLFHQLEGRHTGRHSVLFPPQ